MFTDKLSKEGRKKLLVIDMLVHYDVSPFQKSLLPSLRTILGIFNMHDMS